LPITRLITKEPIGPRLFTRFEALATLKIGETTLFWLQRTGKLNPVRIGSRVLFTAAEIESVAAHGAALTEAEKEAATRRNREAAKADLLDKSAMHLGGGRDPGQARRRRKHGAETEAAP
jgi:hypothetical protein